MALDVFICGACMTSFNDIEQFILHKNEQCGKAASSASSMPLQAMESETSTAVHSVTTLNQTLTEDEQHDIRIGMTRSPFPHTTNLQQKTENIYLVKIIEISL